MFIKFFWEIVCEQLFLTDSLFQIPEIFNSTSSIIFLDTIMLFHGHTNADTNDC